MDDAAAEEGNAARTEHTGTGRGDGQRGGGERLKGEGKARKVRSAAEKQLAIALSRRSATRDGLSGPGETWRTSDRERRLWHGRVGAAGREGGGRKGGVHWECKGTKG